MKFLKLAFIYIQKARHFALRDVFIYKNPDASIKIETICVTSFIYKKPDTLRYAVFCGIFEIGERGGAFFLFKKRMRFALNVYVQKTVHSPLRF